MVVGEDLEGNDYSLFEGIILLSALRQGNPQHCSQPGWDSNWYFQNRSLEHYCYTILL